MLITFAGDCSCVLAPHGILRHFELKQRDFRRRRSPTICAPVCGHTGIELKLIFGFATPASSVLLQSLAHHLIHLFCYCGQIVSFPHHHVVSTTVRCSSSTTTAHPSHDRCHGSFSAGARRGGEAAYSPILRNGLAEASADNETPSLPGAMLFTYMRTHFNRTLILGQALLSQTPALEKLTIVQRRSTGPCFDEEVEYFLTFRDSQAPPATQLTHLCLDLTLTSSRAVSSM